MASTSTNCSVSEPYQVIITLRIKNLYDLWSEFIKRLGSCKCKCDGCDGPCDLHFCPKAIEKYSEAVEICEEYFKHREEAASVSKFVDKIIGIGLGWDLQYLEEYITNPNVKGRISEIMKICKNHPLFQYPNAGEFNPPLILKRLKARGDDEEVATKKSKKVHM